MTFKSFLFGNSRWLVGGLGLTFFSSFGQTFFIALFAAQLHSTFSLSHGEFGAVYMASTLASAITLVFLGRVVDFLTVRQVAFGTIAMLALACAVMATANSLAALLLGIFLLRLFGQGMMSHTAMTAMGRWFVAARGRAVTVTSAGHQLGEAVLPVLVVTSLAFLDWRTVWWLAGAALLLLALPLVHVSFGADRTPQGEQDGDREVGRQWQRHEVLADWPFWFVCLGVLAPGFIGTSVFFHQVHLADIKGWPRALVASSLAIMSIANVCSALITGHLIDRFSARQFLPLSLLPLSLGCLVLAHFDLPLTIVVFMLLVGMSFGISGAVFGAIWPEIYGTRHLGSIRAVVFAAMVLATAVGPGLTGWLIDRGVGFEQQLLYMAVYCVATIVVLWPVSRVLHRRHTALALALPP